MAPHPLLSTQPSQRGMMWPNWQVAAALHAVEADDHKQTLTHMANVMYRTVPVKQLNT